MARKSIGALAQDVRRLSEEVHHLEASVATLIGTCTKQSEQINGFNERMRVICNQITLAAQNTQRQNVDSDLEKWMEKYRLEHHIDERLNIMEALVKSRLAKLMLLTTRKKPDIKRSKSQRPRR